VIVTNPGAASPFLLVGDHAGRKIPKALGSLGLGGGDLERHIAWDIGIGPLGVLLAEQLGACFIAQRFSRLAIDCNRDPGSAAAVPEQSDGSVVPGNRQLTEAQRQARRSEIFDPYHRAIREELDRRQAEGLSTIFVALHSFTPAMAGTSRPWSFGVLHGEPSPFSARVLAALRFEPDGPLVGDNEPYAMDGNDFTVPHHAWGRGLDYLELEVRQDLLGDAAGQRSVASRMARVLRAALP